MKLNFSAGSSQAPAHYLKHGEAASFVCEGTGADWYSISDRQFVPTDSAQNIYQTQESATRKILHIKSYDNRILTGGGDDGKRLECRAAPTRIVVLENGSEFCRCLSKKDAAILRTLQRDTTLIYSKRNSN